MDSTSKRRSPLGTLALTVLALLVERPRHPYEMQRLMRERHKDYAVGKARSFYDAVDRLTRDGLVEPLETSREGKRPERTVYRVTAEGREEFEARLGALLSTPVTEYPVFEIAVSFLAYLPPEAAIRTLRERVVALEGVIGGLDASLRALREQLDLPRVFVLEQEYARALRQAEREWTRTLIADIQAGRLTWVGLLDWGRGGEGEGEDDAADGGSSGRARDE